MDGVFWVSLFAQCLITPHNIYSFYHIRVEFEIASHGLPPDQVDEVAGVSKRARRNRFKWGPASQVKNTL